MDKLIAVIRFDNKENEQKRFLVAIADDVSEAKKAISDNIIKIGLSVSDFTFGEANARNEDVTTVYIIQPNIPHYSNKKFGYKKDEEFSTSTKAKNYHASVSSGRTKEVEDKILKFMIENSQQAFDMSFIASKINEKVTNLTLPINRLEFQDKIFYLENRKNSEGNSAKFYQLKVK